MPEERLPAFETTEHTADIGLVARGATLEELFVNAARGMFAIIAGAVEVPPVLRREIAVEAPDLETLLVAWLNELLFRFETERVLFGEFRVQELEERRLRGEAAGAPLEDVGAPLEMELKAATYHDLSIKRTPTGFEARVLFDA